MIICAHEQICSPHLNKNLDDKYVEIYLYKDIKQKFTNIGVARLLSDVGFTVVIRIKDFAEMLIAKETFENYHDINTLFIYPDANTDDSTKIDGLFKDVAKSYFIKTNESLSVVLERHKKENFGLYNYISSSHVFIDGISKNSNEDATLFTSNILTIYKDRNDVQNSEYQFYIDVDIETCDDLDRIIKEYELSNVSENSCDISVKCTIIGKHMSAVLDKLQCLVDCLLMMNS